MYKLLINKSDYSLCTLINDSDINNINEIIIKNQPNILKGFFHNDLVEYIKDNDNIKLKLIKRNLNLPIVGELLLYSPYILKTNNNTTHYLFKPINNTLPKFSVGFSNKNKYTSNLFITMNDISWNTNDVLPSGNLYHLIGDTYNLDSIYETLLRFNNLMFKQNKINTNLLTDILNFNLNNSNRIKIDIPIYSIDPIGCKDIDDAFSILDNDNFIHFYIHISDVYTILKNIPNTNLINLVSSIYFPNKTYHMLPDNISSNFASLIENNNRLMITLEFIIDKNTCYIDFKNYPSYGLITKNYDYDNTQNKFKKHYQTIAGIYRNYTNKPFNVYDTHTFIECMMITYNFIFGNHILKDQKTVFRNQNNKYSKLINKNYDDDLNNFLNILNSESAIYSNIADKHTSLELNNYLHITSPIRRISDLINQSIYYKDDYFYKLYDINFINIQSKLIKKVSRSANKLYISYLVNSTHSYYSCCYIYDVNIEKNKMKLYFPNEKLNFSFPIVHNKVLNLTSITLDNNVLYIKNNLVDLNLKLFTILNVQFSGAPNIFSIDDSLSIDFY
jgi:exoribonuclease R